MNIYKTQTMLDSSKQTLAQLEAKQEEISKLPKLTFDDVKNHPLFHGFEIMECANWYPDAKWLTFTKITRRAINRCKAYRIAIQTLLSRTEYSGFVCPGHYKQYFVEGDILSIPELIKCCKQFIERLESDEFGKEPDAE